MDKRTLLFVLILATSFFLIQYWFAPPQKVAVPKKEAVLEVPSTKTKTSSSSGFSFSQDKENFYVLENDYQQIVFSTLGGSIAEINLPFRSKENKKSVVNKVEADRQLEEKAPANDLFPAALFYSIFTSKGKEQKEKGVLDHYYPLLRRSVFDKNGQYLQKVPPKYYAFNVFHETNDEDPIVYKVVKFEKNSIVFEGSSDERKITKTYSFSDKEAPYVLDVKISIEGANKKLFVTSGVPEVDLLSGSSSPFLKYDYVKGNKKATEQISLPKTPITNTSTTYEWFCNSNGFFGIILDPIQEASTGYLAQEISGSILPTRLSLIDPQYGLYPGNKYPGYEISLPLKASSTIEFRLYAGPLEDDVLKAVDKIYTNTTTGYSPNYASALSSQGWFSFISEPFAKFLFFLMDIFHKITSSWGISIILLTIVLRLLLYPLNNWSLKSTLRMQTLAPLIQSIQAKYQKDPKRAQIEVVKLYREHKANPFMGCIPIVIQIPFLIGMYDLLKTTFELRGASFIPGWINNLAAPDILFSWDKPIFFLGTDLHFLPILIGFITYLQQRFSSTMPKDPAKMTDQQKQAKMMSYLMPFLFVFLFYNFASGLNIYFLFSTLLGVFQQSMVMKKLKKEVPIV